MRILNKKEVDQKAIEYAAPLSMLAVEVKSIETDFLAGVLYAESKISEIAVEFTKWLHLKYGAIKPLYEGMIVNKCSELKLFELFLEERSKQ